MFLLAPALDDGNAPHAPLGACGTNFHARTSVVCGSGGGSSHSTSGTVLSRRIHVSARCPDLVNRRLGDEAKAYLAKDGARTAVGCMGLADLAAQFRPQKHSLARH